MAKLENTEGFINGFKLVEIWESDFKNHRQTNDPITGNAFGRA